MSNTVEFGWVGKELEEKLLQLGKAGEKIEAKAIKIAAKVLLKEVKKETLYIKRTGNLNESMKISGIRKGKNGEGKTVWVGDVDRKATYGWYVEAGKVDSAANPFMGRSFENKKEEMTNIMIDVIRKELGI